MNYAIGKREPFPRISADNTMQLLVEDFSGRIAVVIHNGGPESVYIGATGQAITLWMEVASGETFIDDFSREDWWVYTPSSSGTVSGYVVRA